MQRLWTNYGIGFHSMVDLVGAFPATRHHVLIPHGLDAGRYDARGNYSFGRGRLMKGRGRRLYDFLFVCAPWAATLAYEEVPEYGDRIFVIGCHRAESVLRLGSDAPAPRVRALSAGRRIVGISSSHGPRSLTGVLGDGIVRIVEKNRDAFFMIFMHEIDRSLYPALKQRLERLEAEGRLRLVGHDDFEECLAGCELFLGDYGSTGLYFSLLSRPMLLHSSGSSILLPNYPMRQLMRKVTSVSSADEAESAIAAWLRSRDAVAAPPASFSQSLYPPNLRYDTDAAAALLQVRRVICGR